MPTDAWCWAYNGPTLNLRIQAGPLTSEQEEQS